MAVQKMILLAVELCLVVTVTALPSPSRNTYSGYSLVRVTPRTEEQLQYLLKINSNSSIGLDFWLRTTAVNRSADVMVAPKAKAFFKSNLKQREIACKVLIQDIGKLIEEDKAAPVPDSSKGFFGQYNRFDEIVQFSLRLSELYPTIVTALDIGRSSENRPMVLLKISTESDEKKPAIWIQGGAHSRELIGPATVAYIALQLITLSEEDSRIAEIIDTFDWYILPVLNPDGYEYAMTKDRLWRKTRSKNPGKTKCVGVDANRNWDLNWSGAAGASKDPCSHNYAGPQAFSEPETRSVSRFMMRYLRGRLVLFLDIHSYSQRWLSPWGYTTDLPPNYQEQIQLAKIATDALKKVHGTKYTLGSSAGTLYTVSGGARDWVYGKVGAQYSYVVELRDSGDFGFVLPKAQILPTATETWAGVRAMACELQRQRRVQQRKPNVTATAAPPTTTREPDTGRFSYGIAIFWRT